MIDIENKTYMPDIAQLSEYVGNDVFDQICGYMDSQYNALVKIEYSGDNVLLGWNVKFKKAGKTLCTVYPRRGHFPLLLIVGQKEKARVEAMLPSLCEEFNRVYAETREGMGQRWLLYDICENGDLLKDILKVVQIRRESGKVKSV